METQDERRWNSRGEGYPTKGDPKKKPSNKFAQCELYDITGDSKDCITYIKILRGDLEILNLHTTIRKWLHTSYQTYLKHTITPYKI